MPDVLIAFLVLVLSALVLALPGSRVSGPIMRVRAARRRRVLGAIAGANLIALWSALTWHGQWWSGPAAGAVMLALYVRALRRQQAAERGPVTILTHRPGTEAEEPPVPLPHTRATRVVNPPRP